MVVYGSTTGVSIYSLIIAGIRKYSHGFSCRQPVLFFGKKYGYTGSGTITPARGSHYYEEALLLSALL